MSKAARKPGMPAPRAADTLGFDELARGYNFQNVSCWHRVFAHQVATTLGAAQGPTRVLDIGCGRGIGRHIEFQRQIAAHAGEMWGIEPDEDVEPETGIFHHFQHALMEGAELPADTFDVAYACMVMEHVADPDAFLAAVARVLKPGGYFYFVTPNARHFVIRAGRLCQRLGIDELVLRLVKSRQQIEAYHYPVTYRFNDERAIARVAATAGLAEPECIYLEAQGVRGYLRGPLRPIYHLSVLKRRLIRDPRALATIVGRVRKPG
ncbi:MAG: class I SAM-dependent methyltransferase [Phycisphaeraceae bacterium]